MDFSGAIARAKSCEDACTADFARHLADAIAAAKAAENSLLPFLHSWRKLIKFYLTLCDLESAQRVALKARRWRLPGSLRKAQQLDVLLSDVAPLRSSITAASEELNHLAKTGIRNYSADRLAFFIPSKALRLSNKYRVTDLRNILKAIGRDITNSNRPYTAYARLKNHGTPLVPDEVKYVSHHTISPRLNGLHYKATDRPHCYSFDRKGYSGWSAFADSELVPVEQSVADAMVESDRTSIVARNVSKYAQPTRSLIHEGLPTDVQPWIFVALQTANDHVQQLARVPMLEMLAEVAEVGRRRGIKVIVKRHPRCSDQTVNEVLLRGVRNGDFELSKASIHPLISGSCAVCTVNSSVGAEALLHGKPVYLFGRAEYQNACYQVREPGGFAAMFRPNELPLTWDETKQFLWSLRSRYAHDVNSTSFAAYLHRKISEQTEPGV